MATTTLPRGLVVPALCHKAPQGSIVASASSSGQHSKEPRVVVTRATRTRKKNSTGHSRLDLLVFFFVTCFGEAESHLRFVLGSRQASTPTKPQLQSLKPAAGGAGGLPVSPAFFLELRGPHARLLSKPPAPFSWPTRGPGWLGSLFDHPKPAPLLNHKPRVFEARRRLFF